MKSPFPDEPVGPLYWNDQTGEVSGLGSELLMMAFERITEDGGLHLDGGLFRPLDNPRRIPSQLIYLLRHIWSKSPGFEITLPPELVDTPPLPPMETDDRDPVDIVLAIFHQVMMESPDSDQARRLAALRPDELRSLAEESAKTMTVG